MSICSRRALLGWAAGGLVLTAGCDMASLAYFVLPEGRVEPKLKHLASDDKEKAPKVVILTWGGLETRAEFIGADRQLSDLLGQHLKKLAEESREAVNVVPVRKVEEFKNANPSWKSMDLVEVGRRFQADYVIYLEMNSMSLYEPGMGDMLMRGRVTLNVQLADVRKPDDAPASESYSCVYPGDAPGAVPVDNQAQKMQFRQAFLNKAARDLSHYFARYPRQERYKMDDFR
ncbi:MAG: hypothetical protein U0797_23115 [Gemmataceae bacterium]